MAKFFLKSDSSAAPVRNRRKNEAIRRKKLVLGIFQGMFGLTI